tara:strand:- start:139 stop:351 length:213 start_codon:yes stop_codon:yes gene_type:complete
MIRWAKVTEAGYNSETGGRSIWINESAVSYVSEQADGGCVINFFDEENFVYVKEDFDVICDSWDSWGNDE